MAKTKKRRYAQDFSETAHGRITDSSFAPSCDVNNIVRHYEKTGLDPHEHRLKMARYEDASTIPFEEAMRITAELDSAFASQPLSVQAEHGNSAAEWYASLAARELNQEALSASQEASADVAPQDAPDPETEAQVQ